MLATAKEVGVTPGEVAIAWVVANGILPIIGPRTAAQLAESLAALQVTLSPEQIARLDDASAVPLGFPHDVVASDRTRNMLAGLKADLVDLPKTTVR